MKNCIMTKEYDSTWDMYESKDGNLPSDEEAFDRIYAEWEKRSWEPWLRENLRFPFPVERMEDEDDAYFTDIAKSEPFRLGHLMDVLDIEMEDDHYGVLSIVPEGQSSLSGSMVRIGRDNKYRFSTIVRK